MTKHKDHTKQQMSLNFMRGDLNRHHLSRSDASALPDSRSIARSISYDTPTISDRKRNGRRKSEKMDRMCGCCSIRVDCCKDDGVDQDEGACVIF